MIFVNFIKSPDRQSAGQQAYSKILRELNKFGDVVDYDDVTFYFGKLKNTRDDLIPLLTDTISSIPFPASRGIRWNGNRIGNLPTISLGGYLPDTIYDFTHSRILYRDMPRLYIHNLDHRLFFNNQQSKFGTLIYLGKMGLRKELGKIDMERIPSQFRKNSLIIDRSWPKRELFAKLLKSAQILISFDELSATNIEANLCGIPTVVVLNSTSQFNEEEIRSYELPLNGIAFDFAGQLETAEQYVPNCTDNLINKSLKLESEDLKKFSEFLRSTFK